ncbi:acyl-CoA thioesterase [Cumulibacter soli]|uniref:acyl-CoA thioesterase n=1 Tax=Cumulibacter soli TaxID=2546344 RepID=UPI001067EA99|nr:acyl-CoA thioesterase domain-containing protein [Cumulibacter soli]
MTEQLYKLDPASDEPMWRLSVTSAVCVGPASMEPFMYGGLGLAAGIDAMQQATGRPLIWASAQYLSFARLGEELEFRVQVPVSGRSVSHARVTGNVGEREVITVVGSLGGRDGDAATQWSHAPSLPRPEDCERVGLYPEQGPDSRLIDRMEVRMPAGELAEHRDRGMPSVSGKISLWMRLTGGLPADVAALALFADQVPAVIAMAMGKSGGGSSLDNTLRIVRRAPTSWVLCEIDAHGVANGMGHGDIHMYAETGELLAVGSQSCVLRYF